MSVTTVALAMCGPGGTTRLQHQQISRQVAPGCRRETVRIAQLDESLPVDAGETEIFDETHSPLCKGTMLLPADAGCTVPPIYVD